MLSDQLLSALLLYGLPVLAGVVLVASFGVPLPATLLLIASGAFVEQGALDFWWVIGCTVLAAILGDNLGYALGRWGGRQLILRLTDWIGGAEQLRKAEHAAARWGGLGIFFSRWLLAPIGPAVNLTSGITTYSWPAFFFFDVTGELLWVLIFVTLGRLFSDRVQAMNELVGDLGWTVVGVVAVLVLAWKWWQHARHPGHLTLVAQTAADTSVVDDTCPSPTTS